MIEVLEVKDISEATPEELEDLRKKGFIPDMRRPSPQERTRAAVMATGNRWAMENFNATHN
jgi:hypothetical protein